VETVDIVIEDADTDQDYFPDAWEYQQNPGSNFLNLTALADTTGDHHPDSEWNPGLSTAVRSMASFLLLAQGSTDNDGDGLDDFAELLLGSDANNPSTSGDGYKDGDKVALGLLPADWLGLRLTGVSVADGVLSGTVEVERADVSLLGMAPTVTYQVLYTPTLSKNAIWTVVDEIGVELRNGVQSIERNVGGLSGVDSTQGFFRVRLKKE
jgi:hypothetical protein